MFATELGGPVNPRNILRAFRAAAADAELDRHVTAHSLRHSAATGWLENGLSIVEVSRRLGHSSISSIGDVYGHTSEAAARGPMDAWSQAIGLRGLRAYTSSYTRSEMRERPRLGFPKHGLSPAVSLVGLTGFEPATP